jgi:glycosyltransferase involved in cell wall biosynthesis
MQKGLVTVVIPNYNYAHYLRETIDSVLSQTYPNIEIIVVDDGSKDGSKEVLASYGSQIQAIFQQNQGVSAARNNGAGAGSGEFIAFLDADDAWLTEKIEKQVARFAADPELGLVHVGVDDVNADGTSLRHRLDGAEDGAMNDMLMLKPGVLGGGSGVMIRREVFEAVGGFDTRLSTSADFDLFVRISGQYRVGFVPSVLLRYRYHTANMHGNVRAMESDMKLTFEKAFKDGAPNERRCYGRLYQTLAGSYFHAGDLRGFVRTACRSLVYSPAGIGYFLMFPLRKLRTKS